MFTNPQVNIESLPNTADVELQKPDPAYLTVSYLGTLAFYIFLLFGALSLSFTLYVRKMPWAVYVIMGLWLLAFIVSILLVKKSFNIRGYALRTYDILYRKGVIFKSLTSIPFNRVQHCEIKQGPIERMFNLKTLEIFTAGGNASDLSIPGLRDGDAQQLKEFIIKNTAIDEDK